MRRCLNPACSSDLPAHTRRDARYCSDACSKRVRRAAADGLPDPAGPDRFWAGLDRVRRGRRIPRSRGATR